MQSRNETAFLRYSLPQRPQPAIIEIEIHSLVGVQQTKRVALAIVAQTFSGQARAYPFRFAKIGFKYKVVDRRSAESISIFDVKALSKCNRNSLISVVFSHSRCKATDYSALVVEQINSYYFYFYFY
jgi:hypothetical protein